MTAQQNKRTRLTIDISPELRRRIRMAAAERDQSVRAYILEVLEQTVPNGGHSPGLVTDEMIRRLDDARERIMRGRRFTEDSTDVIRQAREARTRQLEDR